MKYDEILKLWDKIYALPELKAKLALFGLVIQKLGHEGETLNKEEMERVLKEIQENPGLMKQYPYTVEDKGG